LVSNSFVNGSQGAFYIAHFNYTADGPTKLEFNCEVQFWIRTKDPEISGSNQKKGV